MLLPGKSKYALPVALVLNRTHASKTETTASCRPFLGDACLAEELELAFVTLIEYQQGCRFHQLRRLGHQHQQKYEPTQDQNQKH